ncbi:unnamed protein product [Prorocentrum cordatum]|uniref:Uncharacterized protein n=1 Tax=Prorocentrum cordatum TaxID=2364126 RepID=A0ABN9XFM5_9DINO|nr:unnamed protein product [Polarella glacialis]
MEAQRAHVKGDARTTHAIVRALCGREMPAVAALRRPAGELASTRGERDELMRGHFAQVFRGKLVSPDELAEGVPPPRFPYCAATNAPDVSPSAARRAFSIMKNNEGVGNDGIPGELIRVAIDLLSVKVF